MRVPLDATAFDMRAWLTYWGSIMLLLVLAALVAGCGPTSTPSDTGYQPTPKDPPYDTYGGLGMGYNGTLGIELAPGLVLGFDGNLTPGFGF